MKNKTCCFAGHRKIPKNDYQLIQARLESKLVYLINEGVTYFKAGGKLGFDTMAALAVLNLKQAFPHIRLILSLPVKSQIKLWIDDDIKIYVHILAQADMIVFRKQSRHLINGSRFCLCYLTDAESVTAYTVEYAKQKRLRIINIAFA